MTNNQVTQGQRRVVRWVLDGGGVYVGLDVYGCPRLYVVDNDGNVNPYTKEQHIEALDQLRAEPGEMLLVSMYRTTKETP